MTEQDKKIKDLEQKTLNLQRKVIIIEKDFEEFKKNIYSMFFSNRAITNKTAITEPH